MATLISRVRAITKSTSTQSTDTSILEFLQDSFANLLHFLPEHLLWNKTTQGTISDATGFSVPNNNTRVLSVFRDGYPALPASNVEIPFIKTSGGLATPTKTFPRFFIENNKLFIKPDPTNVAETENGEVYYIDVNSLAYGLQTTDETCGILSLDNVLILFASVKDSMAVGSYWRTQGESKLGTADTDISSALSNFSSAITDAEQFISGSGGSIDNNAIELLNDDDVEMVASAISGFNAELGKARLFLEEAGVLLGKNNNITNYFQNYVNSLQHSMSLYRQAIDALTMLVKGIQINTQQQQGQQQ